MRKAISRKRVTRKLLKGQERIGKKMIPIEEERRRRRTEQTYTSPQITRDELWATKTSKEKKQFGCPRAILDKHPPQELHPLLEIFIKFLL